MDFAIVFENFSVDRGTTGVSIDEVKFQNYFFGVTKFYKKIIYKF